MAGEDQERFEDYLELERYIEELQAGHVAHPPKDLTPSQLRVYRMAALFRSASPEAAAPRPEFEEELRERLLALSLEDDAEESVTLPITEPNFEQDMAMVSQKSQQTQKVLPSSLPPQKEVKKQAGFVSRRALFSGGAAVAAASLVAGMGVDAVIKQVDAQNKPLIEEMPISPYDTTGLIQQGVSTAWHFVTTVAKLGDTAVRFVADTVVGYVIFDDGDEEEPINKGKIIAMSAACTHMGCIVQWQEDRRFHCRCHGGLFTESGKPTNSGTNRYLAALPRLATRVDANGDIYVLIPKPNEAP